VLAKLQSGDSRWEQMVPTEVAHLIKKREFFGYRRPIAAWGTSHKCHSERSRGIP